MIKLLYFCSFVPYLTLREAGYHMTDFHSAITGGEGKRLSAHLCSYLQGMPSIDFGGYDGAVFVNCCNSAQRLYDYVSAEYPSMFLFLLEISRATGELINYAQLAHALAARFVPDPLIAAQPGASANTDASSILVVGSSLSEAYLSQMQSVFLPYRLLSVNCQSHSRGDHAVRGDSIVACPRMNDYTSHVVQLAQSAKAVVFIATAKCDYTMFAYPQIRHALEKTGRRVLYLEEEYGPYFSGRSRLRCEAFLECLELEGI